MQVQNLLKEFDALQTIFGDKSLDAIYGCGKIENPRLCLIFMNPTGRNVSSNKTWNGLKAPWIGTKNVWKMFEQLGLIESSIADEISNKNPSEWDYAFAERVYKEVVRSSLYITNLSKATQIDARHLPNEVFQAYMELLRREISAIRPDAIITFGNQVSSILLNKPISVSQYRKKYEVLEVKGKNYKVFPVYYPVGQGMRNMKVAQEDIEWILKNNSDFRK